MECMVKAATAGTPGFTTFRGHVSCTCLQAWLPVLEQLALARGFIQSNLDILQLTGSHSASAETHKRGGSFDLAQYDPRIVALAREMGAPATWLRPFYHPSGRKNFHTHGVLTGCPHNAPARYQVTAQRNGFDGLAHRNGRAPDPHPSPSSFRSWREGLEWAGAELERLGSGGPTFFAPSIEEDDMFTNDDREDLDYIQKQVRFVAEQVTYVQKQARALATAIAELSSTVEGAAGTKARDLVISLPEPPVEPPELTRMRLERDLAVTDALVDPN
jgi:hypothetical protein